MQRFDPTHSRVYERSVSILQNDSTIIPTRFSDRNEQLTSISGSSEVFSSSSFSEIYSDSYSTGSISSHHRSIHIFDRYIPISRRHSYSHSRWFSSHRSHESWKKDFSLSIDTTYSTIMDMEPPRKSWMSSSDGSTFSENSSESAPFRCVSSSIFWWVRSWYPSLYISEIRFLRSIRGYFRCSLFPFGFSNFSSLFYRHIFLWHSLHSISENLFQKIILITPWKFLNVRKKVILSSWFSRNRKRTEGFASRFFSTSKIILSLSLFSYVIPPFCTPRSYRIWTRYRSHRIRSDASYRTKSFCFEWYQCENAYCYRTLWSPMTPRICGTLPYKIITT